MIAASVACAAICVLSPPDALSPASTVDLEAAVAARDAGDFAKAIEILERLAARNPNDPVVLRLLGINYGHTGRYAEAMQALSRARSIAPADQDIALAIARVQLWSGNLDGAAQTIEEIARIDRGNIELPALVEAVERARLAPEIAPNRPTFAFSQSLSRTRFGGSGRDWYATSLSLALPVSTRTTLSVDLDREDRGAATDGRVLLRIDRRFERGSAYLAASATPDADFREDWSVRTGGEVLVTPKLTITSDLRYSDYGTARTISAEPGFRLSGNANQWTISLRSINLWDETDRHRNGWAVQGTLQTTHRLRLLVSGATYPDTEAGITRRLRSAFAGVVFNADDKTVVRATYEHEERRNSYIRDAIVIGVALRL